MLFVAFLPALCTSYQCCIALMSFSFGVVESTSDSSLPTGWTTTFASKAAADVLCGAVELFSFITDNRSLGSKSFISFFHSFFSTSRPRS